MLSDTTTIPPGQGLRLAPSVKDGHDAEFRDLVAREAKGLATEAEARALRSPELTREWRASLVELIEDVNAQNAEREAKWNAFRSETQPIAIYREERREYNAWRAGANRYRQSLLVRLRECKAIIIEQHQRAYSEIPTVKDPGYEGATWKERFEAKLDAVVAALGVEHDVAERIERTLANRTVGAQ